MLIHHRGTENTEAGTRVESTKDPLSAKVIGHAIEVHKILGPGLLESAYEECLSYELSTAGLQFQRQMPLPIIYKGKPLECGYRIDIIVERSLLLELKAIEVVLPVHKAQLLTYLRLSGVKVGLLINFNVPVLKDGLVRMVV
jgi:GxxExxY protein